MADMTAQMKSLGIIATEQGKTQYRIDTQHGAVIYCGKHQKWQFHGRSLNGDLATFRVWMRRNGMLQ